MIVILDVAHVLLLMLDANVSNKCHLSLPIKKRKKEKKDGVLIQKKTKKKMPPELVVRTSWFKYIMLCQFNYVISFKWL